MSKDRLLLKVNELAPPFEAVDIFGRKVSLGDYRGKRLLLGFFRHAGCPFCNVRVHRLDAKHEELKELGLEMVFFFESTKEVLRGNDFHSKISPTPIVADPEKKWYNAYGIENSGMKSAKSHLKSLFSQAIQAKLKGLPVHLMKGDESINTIPAEFLIDEHGMVRRLHYARGLTDQMSIDLIFRFATHGK
jgi:peroxiredoxin